MELAVIPMALAIPLLAHSGLMTTRFCYPQVRWLSDDELIDSVIAEYRSRAQAAGTAEAATAIQSIEASRETCCSVGDDDYLLGPMLEVVLEALSGNVSTVVVRDHMWNEDGNFVRDPGVERVDACARVLLRD